MTLEIFQAENERLRAQVAELQADMTRLVSEQRDSDVHCQVWAFHAKMGFPLNTVPRVPDDKTVRNRLLLETAEFCERLSACFRLNPALEHALLDEVRYAKLKVNLPELVDAWVDLNSFTAGSAIIYGVDLKPHAREVARSNLTKKRENLKPNGHITKDDDFSPPEIARLLLEQGWDGQ